MSIEYDSQQWIVEMRGKIHWSVTSRIAGTHWEVPIARAPKFFTYLDKEQIFSVIVGLCGCPGRPCCSMFTYRDILEARANSLLAPAAVTHFAGTLVEANLESRRQYLESRQPPLSYVVKGRRVCRPFYRLVFEISNRKCNSIRRLALGDTSPQTYKSPKYSPRCNKTQLCEAFWSDFFKSLSPSPVDGLLLWPGNRSRKLVYAIDFVEWFLRTQEGFKPRRKIDVSKQSDVSDVSDVIRVKVPIPARQIGGQFALPARQLNLETLSQSTTKRYCGQKKTPLFDQKVDSDSDEENEPDVPPSIVDKIPCFSLFCSTRHNKWFNLVKNRPTHRHQLCNRCFRLGQLCQIGWRNGVNIEMYQEESALHLQEVRSWRDLEVSLHAQAKQYKGQMIVLSYDDTSALQLPRFGNRAPKGLPEGTVDFVPFNITNHGLQENHYFYTLKHKIPKGGNRICTFLYTYLRRLKFFDTCQAMCQKLILMADNYSENKCHILLCFLCHLVHLKWFESVELLFGPVGHTHNGNDSVHHCHNNIAGDFSMVTLPEFLQVFPMAWTSESARPSPVYVENTHNWDDFYKDHLRRVRGISASAASELYVRAIKLEYGPSGTVELKYKGSPANPEWGGLDEPDDVFPDAQGFVIMPTFPIGTPDVSKPVEGDKKVEVEKKIAKVQKDLRHTKIIDAASVCGLSDSLEWLSEMMEGTMPTGGLTQRPIVSKSSNFGSVEVVGVEPRTIDLPIVRPEKMTHDEMFMLPPSVREAVAQREEKRSLVPYTDRDAHVSFATTRKRKPAPSMKELVARRSLISELGRESKRDDKSSQSDSSDSDEEKSDEPTEMTSWKAKMADCEVGGYAAVHSLYDGGAYGLTIVKVNFF